MDPLTFIKVKRKKRNSRFMARKWTRTAPLTAKNASVISLRSMLNEVKDEHESTYSASTTTSVSSFVYYIKETVYKISDLPFKSLVRRFTSNDSGIVADTSTTQVEAKLSYEDGIKILKLNPQFDEMLLHGFHTGSGSCEPTLKLTLTPNVAN